MASQWLFPDEALGEYVSAYILSDFTDGFAQDMAYMYPIGCAVLCFSLDKSCVFKEVSTGLIIKHAKFNFIHQFKHPRIYQLLAFPDKIVHVIFKPFGAYRLLGIAQNASFDEHGTALEHLLKIETEPVLRKIEDAGADGHQIITIINQWLKNQLNKSEKRNINLVRQACKLIDSDHGNTSMESLAKKMYLSQRVLQYQFQEQVGLSPKLYSRIIRFNQILKEIKSSSHSDWQALAFKYNYFDQAHFINDFKCFSGNAPAHLLKMRGIIS